MLTSLQIEQMSRAEKLQAMEAIWSRLLESGTEPSSPPWHNEELQKTADREAAGTERIIDWEEAKRDLRTRGK